MYKSVVKGAQEGILVVTRARQISGVLTSQIRTPTKFYLCMRRGSYRAAHSYGHRYHVNCQIQATVIRDTWGKTRSISDELESCEVTRFFFNLRKPLVAP